MILQIIEKLESAIKPPELPPTPLIQAANAIRAAGVVIDRINSTLLKLHTTYPEAEVVPDMILLAELLRKQDFEQAEQILQRIQSRMGYCDDKVQMQRGLKNLAWLIYLLVKDNIPRELKIQLNDYAWILENADWLLRNFAGILLDQFFQLVKEVVNNRFGKIDSLLDFIVTLSRTQVSPCDIYRILNDVAAILLTAKLQDEKIKKEISNRVKEDLFELGQAAKQLTKDFGIGPWDTIRERTRTLRQLSEIAKNWLNATGLAKMFSSLLLYPKEREIAFKMRGEKYEKPEILSIQKSK